MRVATARMRASIAALVLAALVVALIPAVTVAHDPTGLPRFMQAMGQVESGGRYDARNPVSGAYGKYQILPVNWPVWAERYLGNRYAAQTPANQERVAAGKFHDLHAWLGSWRQVAYWWLTGRDGRAGSWTSYATTYVAKVMAAYAAGTPARVSATVTRTVIQDRSAAIVYAGPWAAASHAGYIDGRVRYATARGATATLRFTGRAVSWYGPTGLTRGRAVVRIDGRAVATVDLRTSRFVAKAWVFTKSFASSGTHELQVEVLGTAGRPYVAIDAFVVTP